MVGMVVTPHKLAFSIDSLAHVVPFSGQTPAVPRGSSLTLLTAEFFFFLIAVF